MKTFALAFALVILALSSLPVVATAQPAGVDVAPMPIAAAPAPVVAEPEEPAVRLGAEVAVLPFGTLHGSAGGTATRSDTAMAMAIGGVLQHPIARVATFDLAPRLLFNVKGQDAEQSATQLDLRARVTIGTYPTPQLRVFAAIEPAYSYLFLPDAGDMGVPNGFALGFGAGAEIGVAPKTKVTIALGYQRAYHSTKVLTEDLDLSTSFLHFAFGLLVDL